MRAGESEDATLALDRGQNATGQHFCFVIPVCTCNKNVPFFTLSLCVLFSTCTKHRTAVSYFNIYFKLTKHSMWHDIDTCDYMQSLLFLKSLLVSTCQYGVCVSVSASYQTLYIYQVKHT
jgi:hypothetical protein